MCSTCARIGLNTVGAVIGNMGSEMRFNYTMMGDSVNLAARCESGGKTWRLYYGYGNNAYAALAFKVKLNYRKLDCVVVKGRHQPVELYELWDSSIDRSAATNCKAAYEAAWRIVQGRLATHSQHLKLLKRLSHP